MKNPTTKIQGECDSLFQEIGKLKYPKSLISNNPTNVIHHYVPKSVSSMLRYDWGNAIPLTQGEHFTIHRPQDPDINNRILAIKGLKWAVDLRQKGRQYHKVNMEMYRQVKKRLEQEKSTLASGLLL